MKPQFDFEVLLYQTDFGTTRVEVGLVGKTV